METESTINYDAVMRRVMRNAVAEILNDIGKLGAGNVAPCEPYVTVRMTDDRTVVPPDVRARFPQFITLVFQEIFEGLTVDPITKMVNVRLAFQGVWRDIQFHMDAVVQYADRHTKVVFDLRPEDELMAILEKELEQKSAASTKLESADPAPAPDNNVIAVEFGKK